LRLRQGAADGNPHGCLVFRAAQPTRIKPTSVSKTSAFPSSRLIRRLVRQSNTKEICLEKLENYCTILRKPDSRIVEVKEATEILSTLVDLESQFPAGLVMT